MRTFASIDRKVRNASSFHTQTMAPASSPAFQRGIPNGQAQQADLHDAPPTGFSLASVPIFPPERANNTGMPDALKARIESLSGLSMNGVKVHYNSPKPAEVQALAYTRGTEIHLGPGQERHLPHEAWHVVQQLQGRVQPTSRADGMLMNDDQRLEKEAGAMGKRGSTSQPQGESKALTPLVATARYSPVIQRMEDPDDTVRLTIQSAYIKFLGQAKKTGVTLPKPSEMKNSIAYAIGKATDEDDAYKIFSDSVIKTHYPIKLYDEEIRKIARNTIIKLCKSEEKTIKDEKAKEAKDLEKAQKADKAKKSTKKSTKGDGGKTKEQREFSKKEKRKLQNLLEDTDTQQRLYHTSELAYDIHRKKARKEVAARAKSNTLTKLSGPLSTSDMAMAQASYTQKSAGDPLLLEKRAAGKELDDKYQVSMLRKGGQGIQQLGPYIGQNSVQQRIRDMLKDEDVGLTSTELARFVNIRHQEELIKQLQGKQKSKKKNVSFTTVRNIRAMRNLRAIEMDRGPEVAFHVTAEHRNAELGSIPYRQYATRMPLHEPEATVDLKAARDKRKNIKKTNIPDYLAYIPKDIHKKSQASITTFLTTVAESPEEYPEGADVVESLLNEDMDTSEPSEALVNAVANVMRTPEYTPTYLESSEDS